MILHLSTSGGFGGFGLGPSGRVETDRLPDALRAETCEKLTPERLEDLASVAAPSGADRVVYTVEIEAADGTRKSYRIDEAAMSPEMLDLIDVLMQRAE